MLARQLRSLYPASLLLGFGLLATAACSSSEGSDDEVTHPTMIEVAPEDFLGEVPCSEGPGLKRFVATLIDTDYVAEGGASSVAEAGAPVEFQLPSSRPTPCLAGVGFGLVVPGRRYDVKIDGYDTDDLAPRANGSRQMVSPAPSEDEPVTPLLSPRWTAHCEDAIAVEQTIVRADHCTPFMPLDDAAPGGVRLPLARLTNGLVCGDEPGQIDHFEVSLAIDGEPPQTQTVSCSDDAEAVFSGVPPRVRVSAYVTAFSTDTVEAFAGATCDALSLPESTVDADCVGLSQVGTLRVDLQKALMALELDCSSSSIASLTVDVPGQDAAQSFVPPECLHPFERAFAPGSAAVTVTVQPADAEAAEASIVCTAEIAPGQLVLAQCTANSR